MTTAPLLRIAAPPGTGKSAVLPHLVRLARGRAVVADIDEILEDGSLLGVPIAVAEAAPIWPAYDRLWARIAGIARRAGMPVLLLVQVPDADDPGGEGVLLGWEVDDAVRAERLRRRGEDDAVIDGSREDAAVLRGLVPPDRILRSAESDSPAQAAADLWRLAEPLLSDEAPLSDEVPFRALPRDLADVRYAHGPDSVPRADVPAGVTTTIDLPPSTIFPGTHRRVHIHVPAAVDPAQEAALVVFQDGSLYLDPAGEVRAGVVLDGLCASGEIPPTVGVLVEAGERDEEAPPGAPRQRNVEYDAADDAYVRFLEQEVLPLVPQRITRDPARRAICGGSSGGDAAFTAAWHRPDLFGVALCFLSSFAQMPGGNPYPALIAQEPPRDLRVLLQMGHRDLGHDRAEMNWLAENLRTGAALAEAGYDVRLVLGDGGHSPNHGGVILPDALRWALSPR